MNAILSGKHYRKRGIAIMLSLAMLLTVFFAVCNAPAALASDYSTIRVKLSNANDGTINLSLNGYYTLKQNSASLPSEIVLVSSNGKVNVTNKSNSQLIYSGSSVNIIRDADQKGKTGLINMFTTSHGKNDYLGDFEVKLSSSGFQVINILPMEHYLYGVVAHEMNNSWPIEALKAQSVAARSYAASYVGRRSDYDVVDTTQDQVYKGFKASNTNVIEAVNSTKGLIATYNGKISRCFYGASNGGQTELTSNVWKESIAYYTMKDDPYDLRNSESPKKTVFFPKTVSDSTPIDSKLEEYLKIQVAPTLKKNGYSTYSDQIKIIGIDSLTGGEAKYPSPSRNYKTAKAKVRVLAVKGSGDGIVTQGTGSGSAPLKPEFTMIGETASGPVYKDSAGNIYDAASVQEVLRQYEARLEEYEAGSSSLSKSGSGLTGKTDTVQVDVEFNIYDLKDKENGYRLFTNDSLIMYYPEETSGGFNLVNVRFGHGVGMSQRGAQQMAKEGKSYTEILGFYYDGIKLSSANYDVSSVPTDNSSSKQPDDSSDDQIEVVDQPAADGLKQPDSTFSVSGWVLNSSTLKSEANLNSKALASVKAKQKLNVLAQFDDVLLVNMSNSGVIGYLPAKDVVVNSAVARVNNPTRTRRAKTSDNIYDLEQNTLVEIVGRTASYYLIAEKDGGKVYVPFENLEIVIDNPIIKLPTSVFSGQTNAQLTIYSDSALKTSKKVALKKGTVVQVTAKTSNGLAYKISYSGQVGYVKRDGVNLLKKGSTHPQSSTILKKYLENTVSNSMMSDVDSILGLMDKSADLINNAEMIDSIATHMTDNADAFTQKTAVEENQNVAELEQNALLDSEAELSAAASYEISGTIDGMTVNLRKQPKTTSSIIRQLAQGDKVTILGQSGNFYYVRDARGNLGYIVKDYVKASESKIGVIRSDGVNLRATASTNGTVLKQLSKNTRVTVMASSGVFFKVSLSDGTVGYIHEDYISVQFAEVPNVTGSGSSNTVSSSANAATSNSSSDPASGSSSNSKIYATGKITGGNINMREKPESDAKIIVTIPNGTSVGIIARNKSYIRISYNGTEGYVLGKYLTDMKKVSTSSSSSAGSASGNSSASSGKQGVANTGVNIRQEASSQSKRLGVVYKNESVTILEDLGEWLKISAKGFTGYVLSKSIDS